VPALAERLMKRFAAAEIHHAAVSDHAGTTDFTVALSRPAVSCLVERPRTMRERTRRIQVPLCTLDDVLGGRDVQLVTIDVEGAQQQVLEGGYETIARCQPVVISSTGARRASTSGPTSRRSTSCSSRRPACASRPCSS
jgi:FkbM family methyltransferase